MKTIVLVCALLCTVGLASAKTLDQQFPDSVGWRQVVGSVEDDDLSGISTIVFSLSGNPEDTNSLRTAQFPTDKVRDLEKLAPSPDELLMKIVRRNTQNVRGTNIAHVYYVALKKAGTAKVEQPKKLPELVSPPPPPPPPPIAVATRPPDAPKTNSVPRPRVEAPKRASAPPQPKLPVVSVSTASRTNELPKAFVKAPTGTNVVSAPVLVTTVTATPTNSVPRQEAQKRVSAPHRHERGAKVFTASRWDELPKAVAKAPKGTNVMPAPVTVATITATPTVPASNIVQKAQLGTDKVEKIRWEGIRTTTVLAKGDSVKTNVTTNVRRVIANTAALYPVITTTNVAFSKNLTDYTFQKGEWFGISQHNGTRIYVDTSKVKVSKIKRAGSHTLHITLSGKHKAEGVLCITLDKPIGPNRPVLLHANEVSLQYGVAFLRQDIYDGRVPNGAMASILHPNLSPIPIQFVL